MLGFPADFTDLPVSALQSSHICGVKEKLLHSMIVLQTRLQKSDEQLDRVNSLQKLVKFMCTETCT